MKKKVFYFLLGLIPGIILIAIMLARSPVEPMPRTFNFVFDQELSRRNTWVHKNIHLPDSNTFIDLDIWIGDEDVLISVKGYTNGNNQH